MTETSPDQGNLFKSLVVEKRRPVDLSALAANFPSHNTDWTIPQAYLCLVLSAAFSDGALAAVEQEEIFALAHRSRILKSMSQNDLAAANTVINERKVNRPNWLEEVCEALPSDMHLSVFAHCVDITLADGALLGAEAEFLEDLVAAMSITPDDAHSVMQVLSAKNRF